MRTLCLLLLGACGGAPYPAYWPDDAERPELEAVLGVPVSGVLGGQRVTLSGRRLQTTRTVLVGTRNARVLEARANEVLVLLPDQPSLGAAEDVVVVTDHGAARLEGAMRYRSHPGDFAADEVASVAITRIDCPVEAYGRYRGERYAYWWCGIEQGWAEAVAWEGVSDQSGLAGDLGGYLPLSQAPAVGATRVWGPGDRRPPAPPLLADFHSLGDSLSLHTARAFERDLDFAAAREAGVERDYSYRVRGYERLALIWAEDVCYPDPIEVVSGQGERLRLAEPLPPDASGLWLGTRMIEPGAITTDGWTASAWGVPDGADFIGDPAGVDLVYDDFSGYFWADGPGSLLGQSDVRWAANYSLSRGHLGSSELLGTVRGGERLRGLSPDLLHDLRIPRDQDLVLSWEPARFDDGPSVVVVEIRVSDAALSDPNGGSLELARLVATGDDTRGLLVIDLGELGLLPPAPNQVDYYDNFVGLWAEMSVARHQLRRVQTADGDVVVDFVHVVNAPVRLR